MQKTILITGCSSGIGEALAREFHRRGHRVYASARRRESLAVLEAEGVRGLALDVNDDASIAAALDVIRGGANSIRLPLLKRLLPGARFDGKLCRMFRLNLLR
jgi:NADP-dependent 3-hydroxy acid dehydrogenase YdfG